MKDFFISYNEADTHWATGLASWLQEAGYTCVIQQADFRPGCNFVLEMDKSAKLAARTLAVLSPDYLTSSFAASEWAAAFARDPKGEYGFLVPVRVRECDIAGLLAQIVYIDLVGLSPDEAKQRFLNGVKYVSGTQQPPSKKPRRRKETQFRPQDTRSISQSIEGNGNIQTVGDVIITEKHVSRPKIVPRPTDISEEQAFIISERIHELATIDEEAGLGNTHGKWMNVFKNTFKLKSYTRLPAIQFEDAMQWFREAIGRERNKLYGKNTPALKSRLHKAVHAKREALGMTKPQLYDLAFQRLDIERPISSVTDLGIQRLRKLDRLLSAMLRR